MKKISTLILSIIGLSLAVSFAAPNPNTISSGAPAPMNQPGEVSGNAPRMMGDNNSMNNIDRNLDRNSSSSSYRGGPAPMNQSEDDFGNAPRMMGDNNSMNYDRMGNNDQNFENKIMSRLQDLAPASIAGLIGAGIILTIIVLLGFAFWIWMLVHAIRHSVDYKPVWILVLFLLNIWGAIVYYFAIKKQKDCYCCMEGNGCGNCDCEEGTCKMEDVDIKIKKENEETKM